MSDLNLRLSADLARLLAEWGVRADRYHDTLADGVFWLKALVVVLALLLIVHAVNAIRGRP